MEQEKKVLLTVDTGSSEKTVKSLKKDISDLKDAILNLEKGTDDYNDAVEQLQTAQRELNEVQALTKKTAVALEGSYDALTHQMSLLKKEWRATGDDIKRAEIGQKIAEINTQLKEMDAEIGNYTRNVGNYVSHWEGMPEVTQDFGTAMREMNEQIEPTKQKFESVGKIASGLAAGFATVQGAAALLGVENENLEKTMVKLQAAIALVQGVKGIGDLVEGIGKAKVAFQSLNGVIKVLNKTLGKTGWLLVITLLVTAVASLVGWIKKKNTATEDARKSVEKLTEANDNLAFSQNLVNKELEREIKIMKAQGADEAEILKKRKEKLQEQIDEWRKKIKEYELDYLSAANKGLKKDELQPILDNIEEANAKIIELSEQIKDIDNDEAVLKIKLQIEAENKRKAALKQRDDLVKEILDSAANMEIEDVDIDVDTNINLEDKDGIAEKRANIRIAQAERIANRQIELNNMVEQSEEERAAKEFAIREEVERKKLEILKQAKEEAFKNGDVTGALELQEEIADKEIEIEKLKYEELKRLDEQYAQHKQDIIQKTTDALTMASQVTQGILEITQAAYEKDGEISEQEAKKIKGMQVAIATMNMLAGITAALSGAFTTKTGPWDIALAAVQAASIAAAGTANIMKIKNTDLTGKVPSGATPAVSPNSNIYGTDIPFNYVRNVTTASEVDELNKTTKVVLVESDLTDALTKVSIRESESSF